MSVLRSPRATETDADQPLVATQLILDTLRQLREFDTAPTTSTDQPRERLQRVARHLVAYGLALGHAPGAVIHAVRAELAALGRLGYAPTEPGFEVRPVLPTHAVPAAALAAGPRDRLAINGLVVQACFLSRDDLAQLARVTL